MNGTIRVRYAFLAQDWAEAPWAIHPSLCKKCGSRKAVCWNLTAKDEVWNTDCPTCHPVLEHAVHGWTIKGDEILAAIREVPAPATKNADVPDLVVAMRTSIPAGVLARVGTSFQHLVRARVDKALNPKPWALEIGDDGRVWAPWCPLGYHRFGGPLPLRQTALRERGARRRKEHAAAVAKSGVECQCMTCRGEQPGWQKRQCFGCKTELLAGTTAWKVDETYKVPEKYGRQTHGWNSGGLQLLWCSSCVAAVHTREEAQPDETVVRHMRVVSGGTASDP